MAISASTNGSGMCGFGRLIILQDNCQLLPCSYIQYQDDRNFENTKFMCIVMRLRSKFRPPTTPYSLASVPSVYSSVYRSLPSSAVLSLNFAPTEISSLKFLVKRTVSQNEVVIFPVLFLAIIITAIMSEIRATPKAVYKISRGKVRS